MALDYLCSEHRFIPGFFGIISCQTSPLSGASQARTVDATERKKAQRHCILLRGFCADIPPPVQRFSTPLTLCDGRDGDGGDEGLVGFEFGEAFGQDADGGEAVFLEFVGDVAEPPAEDHHVGGTSVSSHFLNS